MTEPAPDSTPTPHRSIREHARRTALGALVLAAGICLGLLVGFLLERHGSTGRVLRGVVLHHGSGERPLGGLDEAQLERTLAPFERAVTERVLRFTLSGRPFEAQARELGVSVDRQAHQRAALAAGRSGSWAAQTAWWLGRLFTSAPLTLEPQIDPERLRARVAEWEAEALSAPPPVPGVTFDGTLRATYPEPTQRADVERVLAALPDLLGEGAVPFEIPLLTELPPIPREEVEARLAQAQQLLAGPLRLEVEGTEHHLVLAPAVLGPAIATRIVLEPRPALQLILNPAQLDEAFARIRPEIEREPQRATFVVDAKNQVIVVPSAPGTRIDEEATLQELLEAATRPDRRGRIVLREERPELTTEEAEGLGIRHLVARFTTYHPCCQPRVKNIHFAASQVDGVVLRPGERFSLNEHLGPRTNEAGFLDAPTIVRGKMEPSPGGGISQFATTLFNAALDGGYEIVQRQPHTFYFSRYPEGHEATVSYPEPDLVFRNDTKSGLLIKTQYTSTYIRVLLYGDNEGRRVERKVSPRYDFVEPPIEYVPNEALDPEETKIKEPGQQGWTVTVTRLLEYPDGTTVDQTRRVVYRPRPEVVEVHPCNIPKGHKGHTGEECPQPEEESEELEESDAAEATPPGDAALPSSGAAKGPKAEPKAGPKTEAGSRTEAGPRTEGGPRTEAGPRTEPSPELASGSLPSAPSGD